MIRFLFVFIIFLFLSNLCYAENVYYDNNSNNRNNIYKSAQKYMKQKLIENVLKKYIKKQTGINANVSLTLDPSSTGNTFIFKHAEIYAQKANFTFAELTDVYLSTVRTKNILVRKNKKILFMHDTPIRFTAKITNDDLLYLVSSSAYNNFINEFSNQYSKYITVRDTNLYLDNKNLKFQINGNLPFLFGMPVKITVSPVFELYDGHLYIRGLNTDKNSATYINKILPFLNFSEPVDSFVKIPENIGITFLINDFTIENSEIFVDGIFIIKKNCDINK